MSQLANKFLLNGAVTNAKVSASAAIAYSKLNLSGSIVNADVSASAAIVYSKLSLSNSIVNADINASAAIAYSKLNLSASIVNADINASAAIVYSKLSLSNSIVNADINASAAIAYSKLNLSASIVNADIATAAAIARSKIAAGTANQVVINDGSGNLSSEAQLAISRGGTGQSTASAAFNALSPLTTKGDIVVYSTTNTRQPVSTDGTFLQSDSSQATGLSYGAPASTRPIRSVTTTDSPSATTDETLVCSGNSFTITFPTPASGKVYTVIHNGTSLTQAYTLATTGGATLGGVASGSYILYTNGETVSFQFNGTNFVRLSHTTITAPAAYTPSTGGLGTVTNVQFSYQRIGNLFHIVGSLKTGTVTASTGTIGLPNSMSADFTNMPSNFRFNVGRWYGSGTTTPVVTPVNSRGPWVGVVKSTDATNIMLLNQVDIDAEGTDLYWDEQGANAVTISNAPLECDFWVQISGLQP